MRPTSATYKAAIRKSHRLVVKVEVLSGGVVVPGGTITADPAAVMDGSVTLDARAASRGRFDLTLVDDGTLGLAPLAATDMLAPYGNEVQISRGLVLPNGSTETVSIGVFRIDKATITDAPGSLTVALSGLDRSARVIDARFEEPYEIAAGTNVETAIRALVAYAIPDVATAFPGVTFVTPLLRATEGEDRWKLAQDIATACGLQLYFDGAGALTLTPMVGTVAVMTLAEGEDGVLLTIAREWSREGTYNRVIATGENTGEAAPARGVATDDDPMSPTYYFGSYGRVPMFFVSQFIVTNAQALAAALGMLDQQLGTTQTVSFGSIVDASLEPSDTVRITRARAGVDEDCVVDSLTIPLTAEAMMTGATRARRVTS